MKANPKGKRKEARVQIVTPTVRELEDCFDVPSVIPQEDLIEYMAAKAQMEAARLEWHRAKEEVETLGSCLTEALILGAGVSEGHLSARIVDQVLLVGPAEEVSPSISDEMVPF